MLRRIRAHLVRFRVIVADGSCWRTFDVVLEVVAVTEGCPARTPLIEALLADADKPAIDLSDWLRSDWREVLADPQWENTGKVYEWRNYISNVAVEFGDELDLGIRLLLHVDAKGLAQVAEWD